MATTQELDRLDGNPGSFNSFSEREGLDPATPEALDLYSEALAEFRKVCIGEAVITEQVTTESE